MLFRSKAGLFAILCRKEVSASKRNNEALNVLSFGSFYSPPLYVSDSELCCQKGKIVSFFVALYVNAVDLILVMGLLIAFLFM